MKPRILLLLAAAAALALLPAEAWTQCAMCKETVDGDKAAGGSLADGISLSILFMLSLPPLIFGGFGFALWRAYRKAGSGSVEP